MFTPKHLSLFAIGAKTGKAIASAPFYAEVVAPTPLPEPRVDIDHRLDDLIAVALRELDGQAFADQVAQKRVIEVVQTAMARLLTPNARDHLAGDTNLAKDFLRDVISRAEAATGGTLKNLTPKALQRVIDKAVRDSAQARGLELAPPPPPAETTTTAYPLGILATDHAGYLSFDLKRLPEETYQSLVAAIELRRQEVDAVLDTSVWLYALALEAQRFDALAQGRFAEDAVLVKLELDLPAPLSACELGLLSLQDPSLTDWRLSPASFAINPAGLIGADECESLFPANVALQEYHAYQVIRLTDADTPVPAALRPSVRMGVVHEYRLAWYPIGHSLGQILYSLPLAPGESVNITVVDWTRRDDAQRQEHTTLDEQIVHQEHRDRMISETVDASIQEYQHGSSFMGGIAGSGGLSTVVDKTGIAAGLSGSLGGSTASSDGSRHIAATTVQQLSDNITQNSAAQRELQSTVVVHSTESEHEAIETRAVVNYNHSHALTILYYEVLRHFRVVTELVRRQPVLLKKYDGLDFNDNQTLLDHRSVLQAALLDPSLAMGFDAIAKYETTRRDYALNGIDPVNPPAPGKPFSDGDIGFTLFELGVKTSEGQGDTTDQLIMLNLIIRQPNGAIGRPLLHAFEKGSGTQNMNVGERFNETAMAWFIAQPDFPILWRDLIGFEFVLHDPNKWRIDRLAINGFHPGGQIELLANTDVDYYFPDNGASNTITFIRKPAPDVPPPSPLLPLEKTITTAEHIAIDELKKHLKNAAPHYNRAVWLAENPHVRASRFDDTGWDGTSTLLDHLDNRPLEVIGAWMAFPTADKDIVAAVAALDRQDEEQSNSATAFDERLVTLPVRGVFAEAKLGHCNASEEIDDTRFWDWQQSPIPHFAPDIAPATPVTPQPQQPNLAPTPFPQSLVNIVNPPAAPDPTGLAAALNVLGTPNIFRDMSGRAEVSDLLKRLSDNTIGIAEAANRARQIQAKYGSASAATTPAGGTAGGAAGTGRTPSVREQNNQVQQLRKLAEAGDITPERRNELADEYAQNVIDSTRPGGALPIEFASYEDALGSEAEIGAAILQALQHASDLAAQNGFTFPSEIRSHLDAIKKVAEDMAGGGVSMGPQLTIVYQNSIRDLDDGVQATATALEFVVIVAILGLIATLIALMTQSSLQRNPAGAPPDVIKHARILKMEIVESASQAISDLAIELGALEEGLRRCQQTTMTPSPKCKDLQKQFLLKVAEIRKAKDDLSDTIKRLLSQGFPEVWDLFMLESLLKLVWRLLSDIKKLKDAMMSECGCQFS